MMVILNNIANWSGFFLEPAIPDNGNYFGFAQFLSTLALLVVVFNVSDYRYKYRLSVLRHDIRAISIAISICVAIGLLITDVWFNNHLKILHFLNNYSNITIFLAAIFLTLVVYIVCACFLFPTRFRSTNALSFFQSTTYYIHQGNKERLQAVGEELRPAVADIFRYASLVKIQGNHASQKKVEACAHDLLLALADPRFCSVIVDRVPGLALQCFEAAKIYQTAAFGLFARNIGTEFIMNTESSFYQEESGYNSGYFGYARPITKIVFGSYELIEQCAANFLSPFDLNHQIIEELSYRQLQGFTRGALAFFDDYLRQTGGRSHSYTLERILSLLESCIRTLYKLDNSVRPEFNFTLSEEYKKLRAVMNFVTVYIDMLSKFEIKPRSKKPNKEEFYDTYDGISNLIYEIMLSSAYVSTPEAVSWYIQHNGVWREIFSFNNSAAMKAVRFKVRRLLFDQLKELDRFPNFVGGHILGFCLNVLGLDAGRRDRTHLREEYPLRVCAIKWSKKNYTRLLENHPEVAKVCLQGSISYRADPPRLVKTYSNATKKTRPIVELALDKFDTTPRA
jgi:hypothetical protein